MLSGHGVITASQARRLAGDATWTRLLTDPGGVPIDLGRQRYTPPATLAEFVRARDTHCIFPGCSVPSTRCDLDHRVPFPTGPTNADNLAPLCRHHHRLKHQSDWTVERHDDGTYVWTSPAETKYLSQPYRIPQPPSRNPEWNSRTHRPVPHEPSTDPPPF